MEKPDKFYITTTLPYVNSDPHLGFALEMVQADIIARYHRDVLGQEVFFNTGTDEHGVKVFRKAQEAGQDIKKYVDEYADKFKQLMPALGISADIHFVRTTYPHHIKAAQEFWKRCFERGDIYKKIYKIKYCVGCELEKTESDLDENGRCLLHPNLKIELIDEENYFFRFSRYQQPLLDFYQAYPDFVVPDFRFNEIKQFAKAGLQDFSISRLKEKMSWGVPVPDDDKHVMYVWFDALINYVSTLGWPQSDESENQKIGKSDFAAFWGTLDHPNALQIAGKDNLRQQAAMWQAMLMSAGLPTSRQIIIHGFINSGGQKMSKSLGNVADPYQILDLLQSKGLSKEQAIDALRYYLAREISTFEDGDYTWEKFVESYNAGLANGLGNLVSRVLKMAVSAGIKNQELPPKPFQNPFLDKYEIQKAMDEIWLKQIDMNADDIIDVNQANFNVVVSGATSSVSASNVFIQQTEPFKVIKTNPEKAKKDILRLLRAVNEIALDLKPFLPATSQKILEALKNPKEDNIPKLFPRIE